MPEEVGADVNGNSLQLNKRPFERSRVLEAQTDTPDFQGFALGILRSRCM